MSYAAQADLETAVGRRVLSQLTDVDRVGGEYINPTVAQAALDAATAFINSYGGKRHGVPYEPAQITGVIKPLTIRIALYNLRSDRGMLTPEDISTNALDRKWLEDLSKGLVTPGVAPTPAAATMVVDKAFPRPTSKDVSRAKTKGWW